MVRDLLGFRHYNIAFWEGQAIKIYLQRMNSNSTYRTAAKSPKYPRSYTEITPQQTQATSSKTNSIISQVSNSSTLLKSPINSPKMVNSHSSTSFFKKSSPQIQAPQQIQQKLRKSNTIPYLLQRLQKKIKRQAFKALFQAKQAIKLKTMRLVKLLLLSSSQFQQRELRKRYLWGFQKLKLITSKRGNENYRIDNEYGKVYEHKRVCSLPQIISLLMQRKIRDCVDSLKRNRIRVGKIIRCCPALFYNMQKKAIRKSFNHLKSYCTIGWSSKYKLLSVVSYIFTRSIQSHTIIPFNKIVKQSVNHLKPQTQKILATPRMQREKIQISKRKQQANILSQQMSNLKNQINRIQGTYKRQKQGKRVKQQNLREQKKQLSLQIQQKKQYKQTIKAQQIIQQQVFQQIQDKYVFLQALYSEISKLQDHQLNAILSKLRQTTIKTNTVPKQWLQLRRRQQLQVQVQRYERDIVGYPQKPSLSASLLRDQNTLGRQMVRSYVKQRYLWGEVQKFVSKVI